MIYNQELYDDFLNYIQKYSSIENYLVRIGFMQVVKNSDNSGVIVCNQSLKDDFLENFLNGIQEYYPDMWIEYQNLEEREIISAQKMKEDVGEKYESRRI